MRIQLSDERRDYLLREIQTHFREQHGEEIGQLKAMLLLDFFIKKLGPPVYNQAIQDARGFVQDKLVDLEGDFYEPEDGG